MIKVAILTVSDSCAAGKREDTSGQVIVDMLPTARFETCEKQIVPDDEQTIAAQIMRLADHVGVHLILTTGGTGLGPRDITPEATVSVCERTIPGFGELMRIEGSKKTPNAMLSRAVAGTRGRTLIVNLPGSPRAVRECLEVILDVLPHAIEMIHGGGH